MKRPRMVLVVVVVLAILGSLLDVPAFVTVAAVVGAIAGMLLPDDPEVTP